MQNHEILHVSGFNNRYIATSLIYRDDCGLTGRTAGTVSGSSAVVRYSRSIIDEIISLLLADAQKTLVVIETRK